MKILNLANIKVKEDKLVIEFLYKNTEIADNISVFLENSNKKICEAKITKSDIREKDDEITAKIVFELELSDCNDIKIKLESDGKIEDVQILNNKNEEILEYDNHYKIFTKNYVIEVKKDMLIVISRRIFSKIGYEISKHLYCLKKYKKFAIYRFFKRNNKYYLFNDRLLYGDDNAEEFFRYINENEKEFAKNCYFVLDKDSKSIDRLKKIGKVVKYKSISHKLKFLNCKMVISSHSSYYDNCFNPFSDTEMKMYKDIITKQFVFIPHGVIMNDVHQFLNRCNITADLFITSTNDEYNYVSTPKFMYEKGMIVKAGLTRFDRLKNENERYILIAPTWRENLSNKEYKGNKKESFLTSEYYKRYNKLLTNKELNELLKKTNYKMKFLLHPVFAGIEEAFSEVNNENVEILNISNIRYSDLFNTCSLLITDYSSIHFDVATLKKPIIYYQFDKEEFFSKHYERGYFDYEKDGFGDVIISEDELFEEIKKYLSNDCKMEEKYLRKIEETFLYLDKNNSKRVFDEIKKLSTKDESNYRFNNTH